jgi:hypothetical protein
MRIFAVVTLACALTISAAQADTGPYGLTGNDTGGIIPWTPALDLIYKQVAADHCARFAKIPRITSVHRRIGDYVGFTCRFDRDYDPMKYRYYNPVW